MTFRSVGIRHGEDGFDVDGELTLHGVTRPVTLALDVNGFTATPTAAPGPASRPPPSSTGATSASAPTSPWTAAGSSSADRIQVFIEIEAVLNPPQPTT